MHTFHKPYIKMEPKVFQIILIMLFFIPCHSRELNFGERKTESPGMSSVPSTPSGGRGSAQGPNWESSWGSGSSPGVGWGYGSGSGTSSDGFGRGYGFGYGSGTGSGSGHGYGYGSGGARGGGYGAGSGGSSGGADHWPSISVDRNSHG